MALAVLASHLRDEVIVFSFRSSQAVFEKIILTNIDLHLKKP